jgi:hypothetical protein
MPAAVAAGIGFRRDFGRSLYAAINSKATSIAEPSVFSIVSIK